MWNYKEIIEKLFSGNIDQQSYDDFKKDIARRISKTINFYKNMFPFLENTIVNIESYIEDDVQEIFHIILTSREFFSQIQELNEEEYNKVFSKWLSTTIRNKISNMIKGKEILTKVDLYTEYSTLPSDDEDKDEKDVEPSDSTDIPAEIISYSRIEKFLATLDPVEKKC